MSQRAGASKKTKKVAAAAAAEKPHAEMKEKKQSKKDAPAKKAAKEQKKKKEKETTPKETTKTKAPKKERAPKKTADGSDAPVDQQLAKAAAAALKTKARAKAARALQKAANKDAAPAYGWGPRDPRDFFTRKHGQNHLAKGTVEALHIAANILSSREPTKANTDAVFWSTAGLCVYLPPFLIDMCCCLLFFHMRYSCLCDHRHPASRRGARGAASHDEQSQQDQWRVCAPRRAADDHHWPARAQAQGIVCVCDVCVASNKETIR